jgi:hypothetical protein
LSEEELNEFIYGEWANNYDILPRQKDKKQNLTNDMLRDRLSNTWGLDKMLVATGKLERNKKTKSQARQFTFGVVESFKQLHQKYDDEESNQVILLYHTPLKKVRVMSQMYVPRADDLYDFTYKIWKTNRYFLPAVARAVPPNTCSMLYYHSLCKGSMPNHRDLNMIQKDANGDHIFFGALQ